MNLGAQKINNTGRVLLRSDFLHLLMRKQGTVLTSIALLMKTVNLADTIRVS